MVETFLANPPARLVEFLSVLESRRTVARVGAAGFVVLGVLVALVAPSVMPRHPLVGAAVGIGGVLVAVAAALATDANDLIIRGPQHVRAAGAHAAVTVPAAPTAQTGSALGELLRARLVAGARVIAVVPASKSVRDVPTWTDVLAAEHARRGHRVVVLDLTGTWGDIDDLGATDVARGRCRLSEAVTFDPDITVARLGTGADPHAARESLVGFLARVPKDVELVMLAMPSLTMAGALTAVGAADAALVLAEVDVTHRLALIGTLDAIDDVAVAADVILLDRTEGRHVVAPTPVSIDLDADDVDEKGADAEREPALAGVGSSVSNGGATMDSPGPVTAPIPATELIDVDGRDAVRTAAALGSLVEEVWRRGDAE